MMTLDMIMSTDLVTIAPTENLAKARELMQESRIHHLPVVEDDQLVRFGERHRMTAYLMSPTGDPGLASARSKGCRRSSVTS